MLGSSAECESHMSSWPVNPWITYTDGQRLGVVELDSGRPVDVQRPARRVPERVVGERVGLDHELVEHAPERTRPGRPDHAFEFSQSHATTVRETACAWEREPQRTGL